MPLQSITTIVTQRRLSLTCQKISKFLHTLDVLILTGFNTGIQFPYKCTQTNSTYNLPSICTNFTVWRRCVDYNTMPAMQMLISERLWTYMFITVNPKLSIISATLLHSSFLKLGSITQCFRTILTNLQGQWHVLHEARKKRSQYLDMAPIWEMWQEIRHVNAC